MSNQNLPKLFFFNIEPWKEVYNDRFLLKQLKKRDSQLSMFGLDR